MYGLGPGVQHLVLDNRLSRCFSEFESRGTASLIKSETSICQGNAHEVL